MPVDDLIPKQLFDFSAAFNFNNIAAWGQILGYVLFVIAIIVGIGMFFYYQSKFDHIVSIRRKFGDTTMRYFDRGRIVTRKDGTKKFVLLKNRNVTLPPPDFKFQERNKKGKPIVEYLQYGDIDFIPLKSALKNISTNPGGELDFVPAETDILNWIYNEADKDSERFSKPNPFMQYAQFIFPVAMIVFFIIALWLFLSKMDIIATSNEAAANTMAKAIAEFGKQVIK